MASQDRTNGQILENEDTGVDRVGSKNLWSRKQYVAPAILVRISAHAFMHFAEGRFAQARGSPRRVWEYE